MDQRERLNDHEEALRIAMAGQQAGIWTAMPGILQSFDAGKLTATVQPSIQGQFRQEDGTWKDVSLPVLLDCPVIFPAGGGFALTFPLKEGDEGLVIIASRCIDAWWYSGGVQKQARSRMHDLSDGFFLPGCFSQPRKLADVSTTNVQLRSNDSTLMLDFDQTAGIATLKASTQIVLDAPLTHIKGGVVIDGVVSQLVGGGGTIDFGNANMTTTGTIKSNGKSLSTHTHSGVQAGGGNSGPPT